MQTVKILRDYQLDIYNEIPRRLARDQSVLVQAPARSGKSKIIAATSERIVAANRIAFVLTHRNKIATQLIEHCGAVAINSKTDYIHIELGKVYVAMNQTLIKRLHILEQLAEYGTKVILLVDECHRGDFNKTFAALPAALRIGFTATPAYKWAKHLPANYASLIHGPQVSQLTASGNIVPIEYYEMRNDLSNLVRGSNGEFTEASNEFTFDRPVVYDGLFNELPKFTFNKGIVFCASKKSADALNAQLQAHGYNSDVYYSGLKNGVYSLAKYQHLKQTKILVTVAALSEGFDDPEIDFNIIWRATLSLPLFIQMGMRGATPNPEARKPITTVLDFGGNNSRFGGARNVNSLMMDRDWHALWQPPPGLQRLSNGVAAVRICPACEYMLNASARSCCNCGYIYPAADVQLKEGELIKIEHDLSVARAAANSLNGRRISTLTAIELATYAKQRDKKAFAMRIAKAHALISGQFIVDYGNEMGYNKKWAERILQDQAEILQYEPDHRIEYNDIVVR